MPVPEKARTVEIGEGGVGPIVLKDRTHVMLVEFIKGDKYAVGCWAVTTFVLGWRTEYLWE